MDNTFHNKIKKIKAEISPSALISFYNLKITSKGTSKFTNCPFHDDKTPSFCINDDTNTFYCYGCNWIGDVIDFVKQQENLDFNSAITFLSKNNEDRSFKKIKNKIFKNKPETTTPRAFNSPKEEKKELNAFQIGRKTPQIFHPGLNTYYSTFPDKVFIYRNKKKEFSGLVLYRRQDINTKIFSPVIWAEYEHNNKKHLGWVFKAIPDPIPLYRSELIKKEKILIVEGEKTTDAAAILFKNTEFDVVGIPGTNKIETKIKEKLRLDLTVLKNKDCYYWPDADLPGKKAALLMAKHHKKENNSPLTIIDPPAKARPGWDLENAYILEIPISKLLKHLKANSLEVHKFKSNLETLTAR